MTLIELALTRLVLIRREALYHLEMNMNDYDAVMQRLGATKPVDQRDPFLSDGQHNLIVHSIQDYMDQKWGKSYRVLFYVEGSTKHPPGSLVARTYNINKPAAFATQTNDADSLADFICVMQGIKLGEQHASAKVLLVPRASGGDLEGQQARGMRINATGQPPKAGINPQTQKPYTFTKIAYQSAPNDTASVQANRAMLDAKHPVQAMQPQQMQQPQPQPQTYQQPQGQPLVQVPQQQYANQYPQQPPVQTQFTQQFTPQQQTYQQPVQPQQFTQVAPQQYAPVQPQQPVQGAPPPSGFLAMIPPRQ